MPIRPLIREATRGPRFGQKGVEEADDGAEMQAVVLRENVSLVPPDEPEEPTPVEGEEEVDQFVAFGPIEDFQPDWGGGRAANALGNRAGPPSRSGPF